MRKIIYSMFASIDGYIEGPNGDLDWAIVDEELHTYVNRAEESVDTDTCTGDGCTRRWLRTGQPQIRILTLQNIPLNMRAFGTRCPRLYSRRPSKRSSMEFAAGAR
jgi:hypothetical protein